MGYSLFLGVNTVGKSHIMLSVARMLSNANKRVLCVDTSKEQDVYSFFNLNATELKKINSFSGIDYVVRSPYSFETSSPSDLIVNLKDEYDYILVEGDEDVNSKIYADAAIRFLVQDYDLINLKRNKAMVERLQKEKGSLEINIVYNQAFKGKMKTSYMERELNLMGGKRMEIPFVMSDFIAAKDNKIDGRIVLKNFTDNHNIAIFDVANIVTAGEFEGMDKKTFKKIINK